jgi:hypothetical protein
MAESAKIFDFLLQLGAKTEPSLIQEISKARAALGSLDKRFHPTTQRLRQWGESPPARPDRW